MKKKRDKVNKMSSKTKKFWQKWTNYLLESIHNLILERIYSIIKTGRVKKHYQKESEAYFKKQIKILYKRNF